MMTPKSVHMKQHPLPPEPSISSARLGTPSLAAHFHPFFLLTTTREYRSSWRPPNVQTGHGHSGPRFLSGNGGHVFFFARVFAFLPLVGGGGGGRTVATRTPPARG